MLTDTHFWHIYYQKRCYVQNKLIKTQITILTRTFAFCHTFGKTQLLGVHLPQMLTHKLHAHLPHKKMLCTNKLLKTQIDLLGRTFAFDHTFDKTQLLSVPSPQMLRDTFLAHLPPKEVLRTKYWSKLTSPFRDELVLLATAFGLKCFYTFLTHLPR